MFTEAQCDRILDLVMENRELWSPRLTSEYGTLHSLGATSAFNSKQKDGSMIEYQETLKLSNPILHGHLHKEYEQIRSWAEKLSSQMYGDKCEVSYDERLALPGFQIFTNIKSGGDRRLNGGYIHKDYLWDGRDIKDIIGIPKVDDEYSATIIISKKTYSLDIWSDYPHGLRELVYERGVPTMHDHQSAHQVPYVGEKGDMRIGMQLRGFRIGNKITIYF
jgi:hypothetical protein